jgi:type IV secretory pathway TrbD component
VADRSPTPGYEPAKIRSASSSFAGLAAAHVIHGSLVRPALYAGAEPAVVMVEVSVAFALVFVVGFHVVTLLLAFFWITVVHSAMVWVAKQDPQMTTLYVRSLFAQDYYPPHAGVRAAPPVVRTSVPSWG